MKAAPDFDPSLRTKEIHQQLIRVVGRVCPLWMASHRDDLVQSAMLRILEIQHREESGRTFSSSYIGKVMYTVLVDEIRRFRRRSEVSWDTEEGKGSAEGDRQLSRTNPEQNAKRQQLGKGIADCLRSIRVERRQALVLYLQGYSLQEIAQLLGYTQKKTENIVYRGRADLQSCLVSRGFQP
ncbi:MAG: sigma-70 family RNA polymerase sigma factor [Myxococcales bacterium]|nr:sigma-70 family RNA polymerase sigma factor [Myxococcales bacterium]